MSVTLTRIAELAKVSKSAVSIALNGKPGVSDETRALILRIARETGYVQRPRASAPRQKSIRIIAVADGDILDAQFSRSPFLLELVNVIQHATELAGYACVVSTLSAQDLWGEWARTEAAVRSDGVLLLGTNLDCDQLTELCKDHPALVVVDTIEDLVPVNMVAMNSRQGAALAAEHLVALGHTRIGLGRCSTRISNFRAREESFGAALSRHGIALDKDMIFRLPSSIEGAMTEFGHQLAGQRELPSAIFCENDYMAIGVVKALTMAGWRVPDDVSVVGFDDIGEASIIAPELTTIHAPRGRIAELAVDRLLAILKGDTGAPVKHIVDVELVVRRSTAPYSGKPAAPGRRPA